MDLNSPIPKPSQYHFCVRITPKTLPTSIFQSKGIQSLYKIQIDKGSKKQTYEVMRRNLHEQALAGFYKSQKCYFTLINYTNLRPYEMKVIFSEINNSTAHQQVIFVYKFSTFGIVKNFLQNGVRRSTHVVTVDYQTQFYIDLYIQSNKTKLQEKVKLDGNMQTLRKRHVQDSQQQTQRMFDKTRMNDSFYEKNSDANRNSLHSNYSPSRSSQRNSETLHRFNSPKFNQLGSPNRVSMPGSIKDSNQWKGRPKRRNTISNEGLDDARSQRVSISKSKNHSSSQKNLHKNMLNTENVFLKKFQSTKQSSDDYEIFNKKDQIFLTQKQNSFNFSKKPSIQMSQQLSIRTNQPSQLNTVKKQLQFSQKEIVQNYLQLVNLVKSMSAQQITYKFKKNFIAILFFLLILFIVLSKTFDVANLDQGKKIMKNKEKVTNFHTKNQKNKSPQNNNLSSKKIKNAQKVTQKQQQKVNKKVRKFNGILKSF